MTAAYKRLTIIENSLYLGLFLHVLFEQFLSECRAVHCLVSGVSLQPLLHFAPPLVPIYVLVTQKIKEVLSYLKTNTFLLIY